LADGNSLPWQVVRRFSDFESLLWALRPQGVPWSEYELPPKRWFNKFEESFLDDRLIQLQNLLSSLLTNSIIPSPLQHFLEVEAHIDMDELENMQGGNGAGGKGGGFNGSGDSPQSALALESFRLQQIVNETLTAFIDVTRSEFGCNMDNTMLLDMTASKQQKQSILTELANQLEETKEENNNNNNDNNTESSSSSSTLPRSSSAVSSLDGLLDTLARPPAIPLEDQKRLIERHGLLLVDAVRRSSQIDPSTIGDGSDLVCHMHFTAS